jgi:protein-tyrosine phosphatase
MGGWKIGRMEDWEKFNLPAFHSSTNAYKPMKSILFVCTGNIFRSMTAEYALKAALGSQLAYRVSSAGTEAKLQAMSPHVRDRLALHGLNPATHQQRRVTTEMLAETDIVVAMGLDHRRYLQEHFGREVWLFNQICFGTEAPVLDVWEALPNEHYDPAASQTYIYAVVDYICQAVPRFIENIGYFWREPQVFEPSRRGSFFISFSKSKFILRG